MSLKVLITNVFMDGLSGTVLYVRDLALELQRRGHRPAVYTWKAGKACAELEAAGVKRISLATSLYRVAMTGLIDAATEVKEKGTFTYLDRAIPTGDLNAFMKE